MNTNNINSLYNNNFEINFREHSALCQHRNENRMWDIHTIFLEQHFDTNIFNNGTVDTNKFSTACIQPAREIVSHDKMDRTIDNILNTPHPYITAQVSGSKHAPISNITFLPSDYMALDEIDARFSQISPDDTHLYTLLLELFFQHTTLGLTRHQILIFEGRRSFNIDTVQ